MKSIMYIPSKATNIKSLQPPYIIEMALKLLRKLLAWRTCQDIPFVSLCGGKNATLKGRKFLNYGPEITHISLQSKEVVSFISMERLLVLFT
jgi:hypothetical protein